MMKLGEEEVEFTVRKRPSEIVSISLPKTALISLERVAEARDMSVKALLGFYISQCLREDWERFFPGVVPETTKEILGWRKAMAEENGASTLESEEKTTLTIQT